MSKSRAGLDGARARLLATASLALALGLVVAPAPGGQQTARLAVTILDDATGQGTAVRVSLTGPDGSVAPVPEAAIAVQYGRNDHAEGFASQPDGAFYVDGAFELDLEPGTYRLSLSKGNEYLAQEHEIRLGAGDEVSRTYRLERWVDMPKRGWYSADDHIHIRRSPRENPLILKWVAAEDVHVGALLQMGDFWTANFYSQYAWGKDGVYQVEDRFLTSGQEEPRTHALGHTISLGADDLVRFQDQYYHYDQVFDRVRELGGLAGYAHQATSYYFRGYRGMTLDVLRKKVDFVEVLQFCGGFTTEPMRNQTYYQFLDLGFKLTATAGSDFPWCGTGGSNAQIGNARFYTKVDQPFTFERWRASLKAGHTFVSSGPVIDLTVNGRIPGDELDVARGTTLSIVARAEGHPEQVPLRELEIVGHGRVLARVGAGEAGQSAGRLTVELDLPVDHGLWIAARTRAGDLQLAHTTPVYVTVDGGGFHNPKTAAHYLDLNERYLVELEHEMARRTDDVSRQAWRYREGLQKRIDHARGIIQDLRARFPKPPDPDPGALAALPTLRGRVAPGHGGSHPGGRCGLRGGSRARLEPVAIGQRLENPVLERQRPGPCGRGPGGLRADGGAHPIRRRPGCSRPRASAHRRCRRSGGRFRGVHRLDGERSGSDAPSGVDRGPPTRGGPVHAGAPRVPERSVSARGAVSSLTLIVPDGETGAVYNPRNLSFQEILQRVPWDRLRL